MARKSFSHHLTLHVFAPPNMPPKKSNADAFEFEENQIVLAYFGKFLYEAKVRFRCKCNTFIMDFISTLICRSPVLAARRF